MKMDYYSGVTGRHYISEEYKRQGELEYIADIEKQKLKELQKINSNMNMNYIEQNQYNEEIIPVKTHINSQNDLKNLLLKGLEQHKQELKEKQEMLKFIKQNDKLTKSLKDLKKQGWLKYIFKRGTLQRELTYHQRKYYQFRYLLTDPVLYKECRQDLPEEIKEINRDIKINLSLLAQIKESI